jgi:hypothetical protein
MEQRMDWNGTWRNQYGSTVEISVDAAGVVTGSFVTALADSGFAGQRVPIHGVARGQCIAFASVAAGPAGDMVVSYTGLFRDGKLETLWHYAGDRAPAPGGDGTVETPWWRAVVTSADTFERV